MLNAANSYSGSTTIVGGTLSIGSGGSGAAIGGTSGVADNGTLVFNHADTVTFTQTISGAGTLTQAGSSLLILTASNTFTGNTTIAGGTLQLGNAMALEDSIVVLSFSGGILNLNSPSATLGELGGNGNLVLGSGTLTVGNNSAATTYSGSLSGGGGVSKIGVGTWTLTRHQCLCGEHQRSTAAYCNSPAARSHRPIENDRLQHNTGQLGPIGRDQNRRPEAVLLPWASTWEAAASTP